MKAAIAIALIIDEPATSIAPSISTPGRSLPAWVGTFLPAIRSGIKEQEQPRRGRLFYEQRRSDCRSEMQSKRFVRVDADFEANKSRRRTWSTPQTIFHQL
jgi:hypothetical protein